MLNRLLHSLHHVACLSQLSHTYASILNRKVEQRVLFVPQTLWGKQLYQIINYFHTSGNPKLNNIYAQQKLGTTAEHAGQMTIWRKGKKY